MGREHLELSSRAKEPPRAVWNQCHLPLIRQIRFDLTAVFASFVRCGCYAPRPSSYFNLAWAVGTDHLGGEAGHLGSGTGHLRSWDRPLGAIVNGKAK